MIKVNLDAIRLYQIGKRKRENYFRIINVYLSTECYFILGIEYKYRFYIYLFYMYYI